VRQDYGIQLSFGSRADIVEDDQGRVFIFEAHEGALTCNDPAFLKLGGCGVAVHAVSPQLLEGLRASAPIHVLKSTLDCPRGFDLMSDLWVAGTQMLLPGRALCSC
jgi:hypothetical protein